MAEEAAALEEDASGVVVGGTCAILNVGGRIEHDPGEGATACGGGDDDVARGRGEGGGARNAGAVRIHPGPDEVQGHADGEGG